MTIHASSTQHIPGPLTANADAHTGASLENLWHITRDALSLNPPRWISSIFGLPRTWLPPYPHYSEFRIVDVWQPLRTLKYLREATLPAIPRQPP